MNLDIRCYLLILLLIVNVLHTSSCGECNKNDSKGVEINIDNIDPVDIVKYSTIIESYEIIPLETNDECLIGQIQSIRFCRDNIIVLDQLFSKAVYAFSLNGKFIRKIGNSGRGPGEYIAPCAITSNEKTGELAIYDGVLNRIQLFDTDGTFHKTIPLKQRIAAESIEFFANLIYVSNFPDDLTDHLLYAIDLNGNVVGKWLPGKNSNALPNNHIYSPSNIFLITDSMLKYRCSSVNSIYNKDNHSFNPLITLVSNNNINKSELELLRKINPGSGLDKIRIQNKMLAGIFSYSEIHNLSMIEFLNSGRAYVLFYDQMTGEKRCTSLSNFKDDVTNFSFRISGYFYTVYEDKLVAPIQGRLMENFMENITNGKITSEKHDLSNINPNSNPCLILYKCRDKILLNEK